MHASSSYTATSTMPCTTCNILSCSNHPHTLHAQSAHCQARIILIHCKRTVSCTACSTHTGAQVILIHYKHNQHREYLIACITLSSTPHPRYPMYIAHIFILIHYKCNQLIVSYYTACNTLSGTHHPYIWCLTLLVVKYHKHLYTAGIYRFTYILYHIHTLR